MTRPEDSHDELRRLQASLLGSSSREYDRPTLRVLASQPRSGTHWLKSMISSAARRPALGRRLHDRETLLRAIERKGPRHILQEHFKFELAGDILTPARYPSLRMVILMRNPLDALISNFYYRTHVTRTVASGTRDEDVRAYLVRRCQSGSLRSRVNDQVMAWIDTGYCYPVRYEDLLAKTHDELALVLDYLNVRHTPKCLDAAIEDNRFEALSGGRPPGVEDVTSHYRRGQPSEWRSAFDAADLECARSAIGDYMARMGYPLI